MQIKLSQKRASQYIKWLKYAAIVLLTLGILLRFVNLDGKLYWHDEVINSFWVSGYNVPEAIAELSQQPEITIGQLQKYQYPNTDKSLFDPIIGLAINEPQNPPLYYLLSWIWLKIFGNSITVTRSLSAVISLFIFPCIYWLCKELFNSTTVAWVAVSSLAVSPFYLIYAQEARPYSLWSVTILLSSIFLLRAIEKKRTSDWIFYSITLTLSFYTFPFSLFVAIAHCIYFLAIAKYQKYSNISKYITASLLSVVAFSPWLIFIKINAHKISDWREDRISLVALIQSWLGNLSRIFFDLNFDSSAPIIYLIPTTLFLFLLVSYAVYYLCKNTEGEVWLFVLVLIASTAIALSLPDLISGGQRSRVARYLTPSYLGIVLAVAYYLATEFTSHKRWRQYISKILFIVLISMGIISCSVTLQANYWWHKSWTKLFDNNELRQVAIAVNKSQNPSIVAPNIEDINEDIFFEILSFTHLINPEVRWQFENKETQLLTIDSGESKFIYDPLETIGDRFPKAELTSIVKNFWKIEK